MMIFILKTSMTARCGVFATSCVRTAQGHIAVAAETATLWSSTDTAEQTSQVRLSFRKLSQFLLKNVL